MRQPGKLLRKRAEFGANEEDQYHMTSGDMARLLQVDLKTIHNWVHHGHIAGRRTEGRHLRFHRTEVVRFFRTYEYPVPAVIGAVKARVVADMASGSGVLNVLRKGTHLTVSDSLYASALELASGDQEVFVVDLDRRSPSDVGALLASLRKRAETAYVVAVGLGSKPATQKKFLAQGGTAALPSSSSSELRDLIRWFVGTTDKLPAHALLAK